MNTNTRLRKRAGAVAAAIAATGALVAVWAAPASAQTAAVQSASSANWSGYVVGSSSSSSATYSSVSGSWTQPSANCTAGSGDASFWVGLGGAGQQSNALEQVGTEVDCSGSGTGSNYAWYELVPSAPVRLDLTISPGDHVSGRVDVSGTTVTVSLADHTSGQSVTKTLTMSNPDTSSAEWIAEAPSACDSSGNCQPVTLADFGKVTFTGASATANGHTGTISDQSWANEPVSLSSEAGGYGGPEFLSTQQASGDAQPSGLSTDGSSFSVSYVGSGSQSSASAGDGSYGGDGGGYGGYGGTGGYGGYYGYGAAGGYHGYPGGYSSY